ncbi:lipopolysaccharide transport periplasmic protein LptA [Pseudoxanthomonas sp. F11]|jgi:lipopolysaccharide export system protein LptA|uniref:Lipopolysaccharide export system protein LptA n=1 Tax=Pseudoxanthomonas mexicana TaxID=128785 RepID=A0A7G9TCC5_PSEMX|nr:MULTISPECIES: lipopolysaccharide transport periplasmic protein LptA [Pseudoxanthomonas]MCA0298814.1 lipopolysaccharide transport periplasmic protein LptA [Pseudomonadota bacterium]MBP7599224.1 lipopolysaccharide transport periplasmic protein LptA [Pseudoxanthomonas sp.]MCH2090109.1 lipopolysaccharide transport periplasmic protein LptA [Pseudoxanthomonas sp.]MCP1583233.1 lipopolysaccharide export system protein LptA [Pseudoxanthomonas mexicana]MDZ4048093.1 lipopolysaccharide transport peripl
MNRALLASAALLLLLPVADVVAKSSDRNQAMTIDSGSQSGNMEGNGKTVLGGGVVVTQGTLEIRSAAAEIYMADGEVSRSVFTGKQVKMKQQMDDGTWMDAQADRVEYDMKTETITFIGNYTVKSDRGSNSGQRMVYNTKSGNMQSGGDGTRVRTVIQPKSAQPAQGKN